MCNSGEPKSSGGAGPAAFPLSCSMAPLRDHFLLWLPAPACSQARVGNTDREQRPWRNPPASGNTECRGTPPRQWDLGHTGSEVWGCLESHTSDPHSGPSARLLCAGLTRMLASVFTELKASPCGFCAEGDRRRSGEGRSRQASLPPRAVGRTSPARIA